MASTEGADRIERAIRRAAEKARPIMAENFIHPDWAMSADEFRLFWGTTRLAGVTTVGTSGWPHVAPIEVTLSGDTFIAPTFPGSVRANDLEHNPRVAIVSWDDAWHAAIIYGRVRAGSEGGRDAIEPSRIYAIRAPAWHRHTRIQPKGD